MTTDELKSAVAERVNQKIRPFAEVTGTAVVLGQVHVSIQWLNADGGKDVEAKWGFTVTSDPAYFERNLNDESEKALVALKAKVKNIRERKAVFA